MSLAELNLLPSPQRKDALEKCCGATTWIDTMDRAFPFTIKEQLYTDAEKIWFDCNENDWREAFTHHPKIGDVDSLKKKFASTAQWASGEQAGVNIASENTLIALAKGNEQYEKKFGYIFIVCATGKSAEEMLELLTVRLRNDSKTEIMIAMGEQNKITKLRLEKLLS